MQRTATLHSTTEDARGWTKVHPSHRNLLNKGGTMRAGTLGARLTSREHSTRWVDPRKGKVNPPAPVTKRSKPMPEYVMGDTSMGAAVNLSDGKAIIVHEWRGTVYATWDDMQEAIANQ